MAGENSELEIMCSELVGTLFRTGKKNWKKNSGVRRSGTGLIAEFCRIPKGFPNQETLRSNLRGMPTYCSTIKGDIKLLHSYFNCKYTQHQK